MSVALLSTTAPEGSSSPSPAPPPSGGGGGGGGGGGIIVADIVASLPPSEFFAKTEDKAVAFTWKNPKETDFSQIILIRRLDGVVNFVSDGVIAYQGKEEVYTDSNLDPSKKYSYGLFASDTAGNKSSVIRFNYLKPVANEQVNKAIQDIVVGGANIQEVKQELTKTLVFGEKNEEVKILQQILNKNGFVIAENGVGSPGNEGNFYGPATRAAVIKFQIAKGLLNEKDVNAPGYGLVGPKTLQKLKELYGYGGGGADNIKNLAPVAATPTSITVPASSLTSAQVQSIIGLLESFGANAETIEKVRISLTGGTLLVDNSSSVSSGATFTRDLTLGSSGEDVKTLQKFLNGKGFKITSTGAGSPGQETTYFGRATLNALIKFQEVNAKDLLTPAGLTKGTGFFGPSTRAFVEKIK